MSNRSIFTRALSRLIQPTNVIESRSGVSSGSGFLLPFGGAPLTKAGKKMTEDRSLKLSAFYCGVNLIADACGVLPIGVWRDTNGDLQELKDHPLSYPLAKEPSSYLTSFYLRRSLVLDAIFGGNGYARRIVDSNGMPSGFKLLKRKDVRALYNESMDQMVYEYKGDLISSSDIIHIRGFSKDGKCGVGIIRHAADNLGISLSAMEFGSNSYENKGLSKGVLETEKSGIDPKVKQSISDAFSSALSSDHPYRAAVLDEGMTYKGIGITPEESQFLETYASGVSDIARWLNIPPHKLKDLTNANYSNIYQMSLEFLADTLIPWITQMENEFTKKCLSREEIQSGISVSVDENQLLRPDIQSKGAYIRSMLLSGVISQNEARKMAGFNKLDESNYDQLLQPVNLQNQLQLEKSLEDE